MEPKFADIIWVLQKIQYMIEFSKHSTSIFTNYGLLLRIAKQILRSISLTDKLNL